MALLIKKVNSHLNQKVTMGLCLLETILTFTRKTKNTNPNKDKILPKGKL